MLADVLARLDPSWRLVICGEGPLEADLRERLAELGVADRAELRGYVPIDGGLSELYRDFARAAARVLDGGRAADPVRVLRGRAPDRGHGGRRRRGGRGRRRAARAARRPGRRGGRARARRRGRRAARCGRWRAGSSACGSTPSRPSAPAWRSSWSDERGRAHRLRVRPAEGGARARALRPHQPGRAVHPPDARAGGDRRAASRRCASARRAPDSRRGLRGRPVARRPREVGRDPAAAGRPRPRAGAGRRGAGPAPRRRRPARRREPCCPGTTPASTSSSRA